MKHGVRCRGNEGFAVLCFMPIAVSHFRDAVEYRGENQMIRLHLWVMVLWTAACFAFGYVVGVAR